MISKFVGELRKFRSSVPSGGSRSKHSPLSQKTGAAQCTKDSIVSRLRRRAEQYESRSEEATPGRALELRRCAAELRDFAVHIRLNEWNDSDEI